MAEILVLRLRTSFWKVIAVFVRDLGRNKSCSSLKMQINVVFHTDGIGQICSRGNDDGSSSIVGDLLYGSIDGS